MSGFRTLNNFFKRVFTYFKVKFIHKVIDRKLWRFSIEDMSPYKLYERTELDLVPKYYPHINPYTLKDENLELYNFIKDRFTSYIYTYSNPVVLEPKYGWVITQQNEILKKSFPMVDDPWDKEKVKPSYIRFHFAKKKKIYLDKAISIRYAWQNYYHFFIDTLSQIYLLDQQGLSRDIPIIVPYFFKEIRYIKEFQENADFLKGRKIIVQEKDEYYYIKNGIILCKDTFYSNSIYAVLESLTCKRESTRYKEEKIFLKRSHARKRSLANAAVIEQLAIQSGFRVVDADELSLPEQIELFANTRILIGIHGAGLTNIVFRYKKPLKLLELFPSHLRSEHYKNICIDFNFDYSFIAGSDLDHNQRFEINPEEFKKQIEKTLI